MSSARVVTRFDIQDILLAILATQIGFAPVEYSADTRVIRDRGTLKSALVPRLFQFVEKKTTEAGARSSCNVQPCVNYLLRKKAAALKTLPFSWKRTASSGKSTRYT